LLALDAVSGRNACSGAVTGFCAQHFLAPPSAGKPFAIVSGENNLHVTGSGFDASMTADVTGSKTATFTVSFKITDSSYDYALHLRHWKIGGNVKLAITINGVPAPASVGETGWKIDKQVDSEKAKGGDRNELVIELRDQAFDSDNFHDYLVIGLNKVTIEVSSVDANTTKYQLAAIALGVMG
jgi:hypothetical protein